MHLTLHLRGDGGLHVCPLSCPPFINVKVLITASFIKSLTARIPTHPCAPAPAGIMAAGKVTVTY